MADSSPPVIRGIPDKNHKRYGDLVQIFKLKFGTDPSFIARAPGRVNIIGEHIDYCGYGVLPMAVEQDIVIAVSTNTDNKLVLWNSDSKYSVFECDISKFEINNSTPHWYNYFLCGLRGMTEFLELSTSVGLNCVIEGTIPPSAGLSSSSALVCCAALVTMHANGQTRTKKEIADMCANCERYIGTQGGGMDQAISFMAQPGTAKKIDFNPLREEDVNLPDGIAFVISNCCVEKNKAASSDFNTRVVECRLATQVIAKKHNLKWQDFKRLGNLQQSLGKSLADMEGQVKEILHEEPYTKDEVCKLLEVNPDELAETSLSPNTLDVESFKLHQRAMHVYTEAKRVDDFQEVCKTAPSGAIEKLGQLMNASQESCSKVYECSCTELDELVQICRDSGALGSRLTGAGWGGCAVSMVPADQLSEFLVKVSEKYYTARSMQDRVKAALFATQPGGGAAIYVL